MRCWFLALLLIAAAPPSTVLRELQRYDQTVSDVSFALAAANVARCSNRARLTGLAFHSLDQYPTRERANVRATFGFSGYPQVLGVASDSPAARADVRADDQILAVNGISLFASAAPAPSIEAVARVRALVDAGLAKGPVRLTLKRGQMTIERQIGSVTGCASIVEMIPSPKRNAVADGHVVQVTSAVVAATQSRDELAFVIAHELAHNILGHYDWLQANKRTKANVRKTEIEADRLGVALMARAGFDPYAASRFWARFGGGIGGGLFSDGTHMRHGERTVFLRQIADQVATAPTQ